MYTKYLPWRFHSSPKLNTSKNKKIPATNSLVCLLRAFFPLYPFHPFRYLDIILSPVVDGLPVDCLLPKPVSFMALLSSLRWSLYWVQWLSDFPKFSASFRSTTAFFGATVPYTVGQHGDLTCLSGPSPASLFSPSDPSRVTLLSADMPDHTFSPPLQWLPLSRLTTSRWPHIAFKAPQIWVSSYCSLFLQFMMHALCFSHMGHLTASRT